MNNSWGFNVTDRNFKATPELIGYLVRAAGHGANLLLNIGPRPDGTVQPEAVERLREIARVPARDSAAASAAGWESDHGLAPRLHLRRLPSHRPL